MPVQSTSETPPRVPRREQAARVERRAPRRRRPFRYIARFFSGLFKLAFATAVFFGFLVVGSYFVFGYFIRGKEIVCPDLTARPIAEALEILKKENLMLTLDRAEASDTLVQGEVISQTPKPGARIKTRTPIRVVLSSGKKLVTLPPEMVGMGRLQAGIRLREMGLEVGNVAYLPAQGQPGEPIISLDPPAGTGVPPGTKVNLLVAADSESRSLQLPELRGLKPSEAAAELARYNLKISSTVLEPNSSAAAGTVHTQRPAPGTPVTPGMNVEIVVAPE